MTKNILITGLILGKETNMCPCHNINYEWLFTRPSDLLWADKLIVTRNEWKEIVDGDETAIQKAVKLVFERLEAEGMVRIISDTVISKTRAESLLESIESDLSLIDGLYTKPDDENDPVFKLGEAHFCIPSLWTLYAAIELSGIYNACFSLKQSELAYLTTLIPMKYKKDILAGRNVAIDGVLDLYLPSLELGHSYLVDSADDKCLSCSHHTECSGGYLKQIEKQLDRIITLRQYDEIRMTCEVMDKICERSSALGHVLTGDELWDDLREEASKKARMLKKRLPQIKLWSKISSYVSVGVGAASFLNPAIGVGAAISGAAGMMLASYAGTMQKETSWVNFVNDPDSVLGE